LRPFLYLCDMTAEEYEAAFHGIDLPETLQLAPGVIVKDVPAFIAAEIYIVRTNNSVRVTDMCRYRLDKALEIINAE
jgi:hypothetical protein